jgi:hypothetical protein
MVASGLEGTGHSTAPFACECQSFFDNFIAGFTGLLADGRLTSRQVVVELLPLHGGNTGSSPVGRANEIKKLVDPGPGTVPSLSRRNTQPTG